MDLTWCWTFRGLIYLTCFSRVTEKRHINITYRTIVTPPILPCAAMATQRAPPDLNCKAHLFKWMHHGSGRDQEHLALFHIVPWVPFHFICAECHFTFSHVSQFYNATMSVVRMSNSAFSTQAGSPVLAFRRKTKNHQIVWSDFHGSWYWNAPLAFRSMLTRVAWFGPQWVTLGYMELRVHGVTLGYMFWCCVSTAPPSMLWSPSSNDIIYSTNYTTTIIKYCLRILVLSTRYPYYYLYFYLYFYHYYW